MIKTYKTTLLLLVISITIGNANTLSLKTYIDSLKKSLEYFMEYVKNKKLIDLENFDKGIMTTKLLIELKQ